MHPHFLADKIDPGRRSLVDIFATQIKIYRYRRLMPMSNRRNNVLGPKCSVTTKKYMGQSALEGGFINHGHVPLTKFDTQIPLNPGKGVILANRYDDFVGLEEHFLTGGHQTALSLIVVDDVNHSKNHTLKPAILMNKLLGHMIINNRNVLGDRVFDLPGRRLHAGKLGTNNHPHIFPTQSSGGSAAVHCGITTAQYQDTLTNLGYVIKSYRCKPIDTHVNRSITLLAARYIQIASSGGTGTNKDRVISLTYDCLQTVHIGFKVLTDTHVENEVDLFIEHLRREPKGGDLAAHETACQRLIVVKINLIPKGREISRHRQRCRTTANQSDALAILGLGRYRQ